MAAWTLTRLDAAQRPTSKYLQQVILILLFNIIASGGRAIVRRDIAAWTLTRLDAAQRPTSKYMQQVILTSIA